MTGRIGRAARAPLALAALAAAPLGGCEASGDDDTDAPAAFDPREPGAYAVGYHFDPLTYTTPDGRERTIGLGAWYPAREASGDPVRYTDGFPSPLDGIYADAPPAEPDRAAGWPVAVHSHGHQATNGSGQPVGVWLASHGWIVIAPDHTPDLFDTILGSQEPTPPEHWIDRPSDLSAALDHLGALPAGHPLAGLADASAAIATGHSRGVTTVWSILGVTFSPDGVTSHCPGCSPQALDAMRAGLDDPRVVGGVGLAGGWSDDLFASASGVAEPFLSLTGTANDVGLTRELEAARGVDVTSVDIEGGCHESFASGLPCEGLPTDLGFYILGVYTLAFGQRHLLDDPSPLVAGVLDGSIEVDPSVHYLHQAP